MKKYLHIALMLLCVLVVSCSKDDEDVVDEVWKLANEEAFQKITADSEYMKLESESKNGYIMYKVIKNGEGEGPIFFTDSIRAYYKGCLIKDKKGNIIQDLSKVLEDGYVFDQRMYDDGIPATFSVTNLVDGWQTALQHMRVGDRWEIWIPQKLGYGANPQKRNGQVTIPGYSTLVFDLEVVEKILKK